MTDTLFFLKIENYQTYIFYRPETENRVLVCKIHIIAAILKLFLER